jgi:ATP-dependent DNA ligase
LEAFPGVDHDRLDGDRRAEEQVRSRRGWNMTALLSELADLPAGAILDGEIVAFADGLNRSW